MQLFGLSRNTLFFDLLEAQAEAAERAVIEFHALAKDFSQMAERVTTIKKIESDADALTHRLANKADATFITPLDQEDLRAVSSALDDITDNIEGAAGRIELYRLTTPRPELEPLVTLLVRLIKATRSAVAVLRNMRGRESVQDVLICVHQIENEGDTLYRQAIADLLNSDTDNPLLVIKWKEIFDRIEIAMDKCEHVANIVERVVVKYA